MAEILTDLEAARDDKLEITKILNGKFIKAGPNRVGYIDKCEWKWTTWGQQRYSDEAREMACAFAEGQ